MESARGEVVVVVAAGERAGKGKGVRARAKLLVPVGRGKSVSSIFGWGGRCLSRSSRSWSRRNNLCSSERSSTCSKSALGFSAPTAGSASTAGARRRPFGRWTRRRWRLGDALIARQESIVFCFTAFNVFDAFYLTSLMYLTYFVQFMVCVFVRRPVSRRRLHIPCMPKFEVAIFVMFPSFFFRSVASLFVCHVFRGYCFLVCFYWFALSVNCFVFFVLSFLSFLFGVYCCFV